MANPIDYFRELGLFIAEFGSTESWLLLALQDQSNVRPPLSQALFAGFKVAAAKDAINRVREVKGLPVIPRVASAFAQLTEITTLRNDIVHYGAQFLGDWEPHVTNSMSAMPGKTRHTIATPALLRSASNDLVTIRGVITNHLFTNVERDPDWVEPPETPWRYIPDRQVHIRPPSRDRNPAPAEQPPASQG
jgi:hypothetical protein